MAALRDYSNGEKFTEPGVSISTHTADWNRAEAILQELREQFSTPIHRLREISEDLVEEMKLGLQSHEGSKWLEMVITYVDRLPNGTEKGTFYALDLGGTNFRVLCVELKENKGVVVKDFLVEKIPAKLMSGSEHDLFDFIASKLAKFVERQSDKGGELNKPMELGFTFSFPVHQTAIDSGNLIKWTKGFCVKETVGKDIVLVLKEAMHRHGLDMEVTVLANDAVGTLACGVFEDHDVVAAVIVGTGTNACYVEHISAIPKWQGPPPESGYMVINTEFGSFWSSKLPRIEVDIAVDKKSRNPGSHLFEKLISGMYLSKIARKVLLKLAEEAALFGDAVPPRLRNEDVLTTKDISDMHHDESLDLEGVETTLRQTIGVSDVPDRTRRLIVEVCNIITLRAARLAGAGIVGVLKKLGRDKDTDDARRRTVVAIDGALYEKYPHYRRNMETALVELLGSHVAETVELKLFKDGSGIGGALLAASNSKYRKKFANSP